MSDKSFPSKTQRNSWLKRMLAEEKDLVAFFRRRPELEPDGSFFRNIYRRAWAAALRDSRAKRRGR